MAAEDDEEEEEEEEEEEDHDGDRRDKTRREVRYKHENQIVSIARRIHRMY